MRSLFFLLIIAIFLSSCGRKTFDPRFNEGETKIWHNDTMYIINIRIDSAYYMKEEIDPEDKRPG